MDSTQEIFLLKQIGTPSPDIPVVDIEEGEEIQLETQLCFGSLSDPKFNTNTNLLLVPQNCIALNNHGIAYDIVNKYAYSNIVRYRYSDPNVSYLADVNSRSDLGSVQLSTPPHYISGPIIANCFVQYGFRRPYDENVKLRSVINNFQEESLRENIKSDTSTQRVQNFKTVMSEISEKLVELQNISSVLIPIGIGRRGKVDEMWITHYLPIIADFSKKVKALSKDVVLVVNQSYLRYLERQYRNHSVPYIRKAFDAIATLPLFNVEDCKPQLKRSYSFYEPQPVITKFLKK